MGTVSDTKDRFFRAYREPEPGYYSCTWYSLPLAASVERYPKFAELAQAVQLAISENVPATADVQWDGIRLILHWNEPNP